MSYFLKSQIFTYIFSPLYVVKHVLVDSLTCLTSLCLYRTHVLHNAVTCFAAIHPAMCDHSGFLHHRAGGWPHYFYQQSPTEAQRQTAAYYDVVNFARQLKVPGWFSWGYNDEVCPPTSMFSAYNSITAPKAFHPYLETGHFWYQEQYDAWNDWLWQQLGLR